MFYTAADLYRFAPPAKRIEVQKPEDLVNTARLPKVYGKQKLELAQRLTTSDLSLQDIKLHQHSLRGKKKKSYPTTSKNNG